MWDFKHFVKLLLRSGYRQHHYALRKLSKTPRYTQISTNLLGTEIELVDAASFLFMYKEIFEQQIFRFKAKNNKPVIIDCGANIGLSAIYFKQLYPESHVIAFEPDKKIFQILEKNIRKFKLSNVELINKAIWNSKTNLEFMAEGADAGRIVHIKSEWDSYQVPTARLRDYLKQPIDLLKLDIEGAEVEVIRDCQEMLFNVNNLFVEYHSFTNEPQTLHYIVNILDEAGFRLYIQPSVPFPQPFYRRNIYLDMDIQLNIYSFRE